MLKSFDVQKNIYWHIISGKATYFAQPLDVAINSVFKAALRHEWEAWVRDVPAEFTAKGYRKRPSYQEIVDMVSNALSTISSENIKRAFECCGIASMGRSVGSNLLNQRLKTILSWEKGAIGLAQISSAEIVEQSDEDQESDDEQLLPIDPQEQSEEKSDEEDDYSDEYE